MRVSFSCGCGLRNTQTVCSLYEYDQVALSIIAGKLDSTGRPYDPTPSAAATSPTTHTLRTMTSCGGTIGYYPPTAPFVDGPASTCLSADPGPGPSFGGGHRPFEWGWRAVVLCFPCLRWWGRLCRRRCAAGGWPVLS